MPRTDYAPQQVVSAEVIQTRDKSQYPGQRRRYNYVVRLTTENVDTGELMMVNEYRSLASDRALSSETVLARMTEIIESGL